MVFTKEMIDAIAESEGGLYDVVYLYGGRAAVAERVEEILRAYGEKNPGNKLLRTNGADFLAGTGALIHTGCRFGVPECDLYVLEELDGLAGRESAEERLYGILDHQLEHKGRVLVTGQEPVSRMFLLADRINAQLAGGVSFRVE